MAKKSPTTSRASTAVPPRPRNARSGGGSSGRPPSSGKTTGGGGHNRRPGPPRQLPIFTIVVAAVAIIGIAVVVGVLLTRGEDANSGDQTAAVTVDGDPLPTGTAVGQTAPTVTGTSFDGTPVTIANDGVPKLVIFFAHWCPHCQAEMPRLVDWSSSGVFPDGLEVVGISTGVDPAANNYPPSAWFENEGWPYPVIRDSDARDAADAFGLESYPYFVAIDSEGKVVARQSGELDQAGVEALVDAAMGTGT